MAKKTSDYLRHKHGSLHIDWSYNLERGTTFLIGDSYSKLNNLMFLGVNRSKYRWVFYFDNAPETFDSVDMNVFK